MGGTMSDYKYKAFISYRHLEPDMQAAEKLQKLLESYKPPKNLGKEKGNWRIFRDVSELQTSSDLSEDIRNAIENSEYLIVICSPKYTESKWCMQELVRFRELHGNTNQNIITLLVAGEPKEAFPELLQYNEVTTTDENGQEVKVKVEVEPLAANIKADTLKESMKKLNTEYLRIAAPLIGCDFNDLYQREKKREARRRMQVFGLVSGVLSVITVISLVSAVTINKKNSEIKNKNEQIEAKNEQIEKKNKDLLIENAGHLAAESEKYYGESDLIPAIQKAVAALPKEGEDKPAIPEAEYALSRELGMFRCEQIIPRLALKHDSAVENISFMGGGKSIVSTDATGVYFWDPETGKLIKKISPADPEFASKKESSNRLDAYLDIDTDKTGTVMKNVSAPGSVSYEITPVLGKVYKNYVHNLTDDEPGTGGDVYICNSDRTVWRLDGATGEVKWCAEASDKAYSYVSIAEDDEHILRVYHEANTMPDGTPIAGKRILLEVIDRETGNITITADLSALGATAYDFDINNEIQCVKNNKLYIYNNKDNRINVYTLSNDAAESEKSIEISPEYANLLTNGSICFIDDDALVSFNSSKSLNSFTSLRRFDSDVSEEKWSTEVQLKITPDAKKFLFKNENTSAGCDILAIVTNIDIVLINYDTGNIIRTITLDSHIVDTSFTRTGLIMITVEDGIEYTLNVASYTASDNQNSAYRTQNFNMGFNLCSYSRNKYVTAGSYSSTAYIQYTAENPSYTKLKADDFDHKYRIISTSPDGTYALVSATWYENNKYNENNLLKNNYYFYNSDKDEITAISALTDLSLSDAVFVDNTSIIAAVFNPKGAAEKKLVIFKTGSDVCEEIADPPEFDPNNIKLFAAGSGAVYIPKDKRSAAYVGLDKTVKLSTVDKDDFDILDEYTEYRSGKAAVLLEEHSSGKLIAEVRDPVNGKNTNLALECHPDTGLNIYRMFWQDDNTIGVFFSDRTVKLYNAQTGELTNSVDLSSTSQEPLSVIPLSDDTFGVLCRDSGLYEMNSNGYTGRKLKLDTPEDYGDALVSGLNGKDAARLNVSASADKGYLYVIWKNGVAWLIDLDKFKCRYQIDGYQAAPSGKSIVYASDLYSDKVGWYPIYTTNQLIQTAGEYLDKMSEKVQEAAE